MSDKWKYVSVGKCIKTIIFSIVALCVVFVPLAFGPNNPLVFTFNTLPFIGDGTIATVYEANIASLITGLGFGFLEGTLGQILFVYTLYAYFIILILNVLFSITLAITRVNVLRIIFKYLSFIFAIIMIITAAANLLMFVGTLINAFSGTGMTFTDAFCTSGALLPLIMAGFAIMMAIIQFKAYNKAF